MSKSKLTTNSASINLDIPQEVIVDKNFQQPKIIKPSQNQNYLEDIFKKQNLSDEIYIKIKFMKRKLGDAQTLNVIKQIDKSNGMTTRDELNSELIKIIGREGLLGIEQTLNYIIKSSGVKFK